jgi:hypothetical protein
VTVAFDIGASANGSSITSLTFTHVLGATATGIAVFTSGYNEANGPFSCSVGVSSAPSYYELAPANYFTASDIDLFGLTSPPTGSQTITISQAGGGAGGQYICATSISVTGGVTSGSPFRNTPQHTTATSTTASLVVNSANGDLVVSGWSYSFPATATPTGTGQTIAGVQEVASAVNEIASYQPSTGATATASWSNTQAAAVWDLWAASFQIAAGGGDSLLGSQKVLQM